MFLLDADELKRLTGYGQPFKQREALRSMGVKHAVRPDGTPVVTCDAVREYTGGSASTSQERATINLSAVSNG